MTPSPEKKSGGPSGLGGLTWRRALPQLGMLALILLLNWLISPQFFNVSVQGGRLFGSVIDVFYRGAPIIILALGMTLVIATGGIDLSVGAVIAIAGATAASLVQTSGLPAWHVDAEVRVTGIPGVTGDRVQLVVVEHPSQGRLLLITCHALNHTPTQTAAAAVWSSFRVTK